MRDIGIPLLARLAILFECTGEMIEVAGEIAEFVAARNDHALAVFASGQRARGVRQ